MSDKRNIGWILYFTALCLVLGTLLSCNPSDIIPFEPEPDTPVPEAPVPDGTGEPSQPVDPPQPVEPSEPEGPTDPEEPESPTDPEDPEQPTDPEEPEQPHQPAEGKSIVFVDGVTATSGWYDVNKVKDGTVNGDINMCWAATAANILQWWQDRYVEQGNELPEGCPDGKGETYELAIMEVFHTQWDNTYGGHAFHAVKWYFEGVNVCEGWNRQAQPLQRGSGGYFKHEWEQIEPYMYTGHNLGYTQDYNNYYLWGSGSGLNATGRLKAFTELVELFIDKGMTSMAIAQRENYGGVHHSVTLWGYEKDNETGLLTRIWITDSDDSAQWPREPVLHEYKVSSTESGAIKFNGDVYAACYPVSLYPVSGYLSVR